MRSNEISTRTRPEFRTHRPHFSNRQIFHPSNGNQMLTNVFRDEGSVNLEIALPGVKKDEVLLKIANRVLTIEVTTVQQSAEPAFRNIRREFSVRPVTREFKLSDKIDTERIKAEMQDGILAVTLPLVVEQEINKNIEIK